MDVEDVDSVDEVGGAESPSNKTEIPEENVEMLLNAPDYEKVDSEVEEEVNQLIKDEIPELEFKCRCCKFVGNSFQEVEKHENGHRARGTFLECEYCDFCTNTRDLMIQHVTKHTGERPFKCKKCNFSSRWKRDLIKHQVKHSDEKKFMCSQCDFTTKWYNNIKHHLIKHSNERPFSCHICDMKFKRKTGLDYHLYRHNDYKPKKCPTCDFRCKTNFELKLHQHKHSNVRNFPCTFPGCTQRCKTKSDLSKHIKIHSNVRDKICDVCDKGFATFANLSKHKLRHVTERKFQCELCTRKFKTRISLRNHLQTHNDHKPFACDVCGHRFRNRHNMKSHKLTHSEDRVFKCPICPYAGKFPFHIFAHIGTFHGDKYAYFCEICRKPFRRYSQLQTHCGRMHKDCNLLKAIPEIKREVIDEGDNQTDPGPSETSTDVHGDEVPNRKTDEPQSTPKSAETRVDESAVTGTVDVDLSGHKNETELDTIKENQLTPKIEDPNVIIYNVGPFRLPLATKGFDFNFEKTGKKPKQWFMDPQNMKDQSAAEKQRAYMEKRSRTVDKSRGATMRKFGWKKPPYKPCVEDKPRYKQERERLKREREAGRNFVKQDPDLMELINVGRSNIRKVKICKRAGMLMKNWKELEVKLEKIDGFDAKSTYVQLGKAIDGDVKEVQTVESLGQETPIPKKRKVGRPKSVHVTKKAKLSNKSNYTSSVSTPHSNLDSRNNVYQQIETESITSKVTKTKRPVGRPRKHPKKTDIPTAKKVKSALDLIAPVPEFEIPQTPDQQDIPVVPEYISSQKKDFEDSAVPTKSDAKCSTISSEPSAYLSRANVSSPTLSTESITAMNDDLHNVDAAASLSGNSKEASSENQRHNDSSKLPRNDLQSTDVEEKKPNSQPYKRTILSIPKIPRRAACESSSTNTSTMVFVGKPKKTTGRLNMAIDKLIAKKVPAIKTSSKKQPRLWQPFISDLHASSSTEDLSLEIKRHRKSDAPRKIYKQSQKQEEDNKPSSSKATTEMSYEDFISELRANNENQALQKRKPGRPKKIGDPNSPQKILENLLCQPFRSKRNLTDLDVLERLAPPPTNPEPDRAMKHEDDLGHICSKKYPITLLPIYETMTLIDILTTPPKRLLDFSFKTTELVGPEPDRSIGLPDISSLQEKDELLKIQKCLRNEKYRLKKLDPESVAIKHISKMISTGRGTKPEKNTKPTDCPILKNVLMRSKEADAITDDDVIITDVQDLPQKPIKLVIKKNKILKPTPIEIEAYGTEGMSSEQMKKSKKLNKKENITHPNSKIEESSFSLKTAKRRKDPLDVIESSVNSKEVQRIKRKYTKKLAGQRHSQENSPKQKVSSPQKISNAKMGDYGSSRVRKNKTPSLGKNCLASSDIKEVLQKYIKKKRNITPKNKTEKKIKVPKKKIEKKKASKLSSKVKDKGKVKQKTKTKKLQPKTKQQKLKKSYEGKVAKARGKGKPLKVKIPRNSKSGVEIYVDIEEHGMEEQELFLEDVSNSLNEEYINFPQGLESKFPKNEPIDEHDSYDGISEEVTGLGEVKSVGDDCKLDIQSDNLVELKSEVNDALLIKNEVVMSSETLTIKLEPGCFEPFGQYEDISEDEPEIVIKEETHRDRQKHELVDLIHVKYL